MFLKCDEPNLTTAIREVGQRAAKVAFFAMLRSFEYTENHRYHDLDKQPA